jgi:hypothetical protein
MDSVGSWFSAEKLLQTGGGGILLWFMLFAFAKGIARQLLGMVSLAVGFLAGYIIFKNAPEHLQQWFGKVHPKGAITASIIGGTLVHLMVRRILGGLINPDSGVPNTGGMRVRSAGLSVIPACFLLWVIAMGVRWTGALAQMEFIDEGIRAEKNSLQQSSPLFARLQQSLTTGWVGNMLNRTDPVSSTEAGALCSLLLIQRDEESWGRLHRDPAALPILRHPAVVRLVRDKDWNKPASYQNYAELITLPELAVALKDQQLVAMLQKLDLEKTARHALGATVALE